MSLIPDQSITLSTNIHKITPVIYRSNKPFYISFDIHNGTIQLKNYATMQTWLLEISPFYPKCAILQIALSFAMKNFFPIDVQVFSPLFSLYSTICIVPDSNHQQLLPKLEFSFKGLVIQQFTFTQIHQPQKSLEIRKNQIVQSGQIELFYRSKFRVPKQCILTKKFNNPCLFIAPLNDKKLLVIVRSDNFKAECKILSAKSLELYYSFPIGSCAFVPTPIVTPNKFYLILSNLAQNEILMYFIPTGKEFNVKSISPIKSLCVTDDSKTLVIGMEHKICLFSIPQMGLLSTIHTKGASIIYGVIISKDNLYYCDHEGKLGVVSLKTNKVVFVKDIGHRLLGIQSGDDTSFVSPCSDYSIKKIDYETLSIGESFSGFKGSITQCLIENNYLIGCSSDKTIRIFDFSTTHQLNCFENHSQWVFHCCILDECLYSVSIDKTLNMYK